MAIEKTSRIGLPQWTDPEGHDPVRRTQFNAAFNLIDAAWMTLGCNVRDFGAVGDGVADDTAAIQAAINAAVLTHGAVIIPPGRYRVTAQLNVTAPIRIYGAGAFLDQTVSHVFGSASWTAETVKGSVLVSTATSGFVLSLGGHDVALAGFAIVGVGNATRTSRAISSLDTGFRVAWRDLIVCNFMSGVELHQPRGFTASNLDVRGCATAVSGTSEWKHVTIVGLYVSRCAAALRLVNASYGVVVDGLTAVDCTGTVIDLVSASSCLFRGVRLANPGCTTAIRVRVGTRNVFDGVTAEHADDDVLIESNDNLIRANATFAGGVTFTAGTVGNLAVVASGVAVIDGGSNSRLHRSAAGTVLGGDLVVDDLTINGSITGTTNPDHAARHAVGGLDPVTPTAIGAAAAVHASRHAAGGADPVTSTAIGAAGYTEAMPRPAASAANKGFVHFDGVAYSISDGVAWRAPLDHRMAYLSTGPTQIIATASDTTVLYGDFISNREEDGVDVNPSTGLITITRAGVWLLILAWKGYAHSGYWRIATVPGGTNIGYNQHAATGVTTTWESGALDLNVFRVSPAQAAGAGFTCWFTTRQNSGANQNFNSIHLDVIRLRDWEG